jgi:hypothetical protein
MRKNEIEIVDSKGHMLIMRIWTPSFWTAMRRGFQSKRHYHAGDWEALTYGFIKYKEGDTLTKGESGFSGRSLLIGGPDSIDEDVFHWGMKLHDYDDVWGTNDKGLGEVAQWWCLHFEPGEIKWYKFHTESAPGAGG